MFKKIGFSMLVPVFIALEFGGFMLNVNAESKPLPGHLRINYHRDSGDYNNAALWLWDDVESPSKDWPGGASPFSGETDFGVYLDVKLAKDAESIGFLVLDRENGNKDAGNKSFRLPSASGKDISEVNSSSHEIFIKEGDDNVYMTSETRIMPRLLSASISAPERLLLSLSTVEGLEEKFKLTDVDGNKIEAIKINVLDNDRIELEADFSLEAAPVTIEYNGVSVNADKGWRLIDSLYAYEGDDLGCSYDGHNALFKLWAPLAESVKIIIFDRYNQKMEICTLDMNRGDRGVWHISLADDELFARSLAPIKSLSGFYYQYEVVNPGREPRRVLDPYALSMAPVTVGSKAGSAGSSNDFVGKAAIVDLKRTGEPKPFKGIKEYKKREDAIIWEVHIRDFTSDPKIGDNLNARWGSFRSFIERIPYIKSLGVTHVQILPVNAWYYGDETRMGERELEYSAGGNNYNWGYDPQNYFSLDGAYSENPEDPYLRIREFKDLVEAVHDAGMGVIMDVVYTHMASASFLDDIVPDYYFFQDENGNFLGDFGNNLATNRKMAEKFMIDSVKHWFRNYGIDGMRWDMMGDATADSVQKAYDEARSINSDVIFIGEGWRTFKGHIDDPSLAGGGADQDWMARTDSVGVFSDELRNELKSGFGSEGDPMFITGGARNIQHIFNVIKAQPDNTPATAPGDMVQYIAAHDNLPLYDVIAQSIKKDPALPSADREILRRIRLGNAIVLTAQGTSFIHAGQEYGRTKQWLADGEPEQKYHVLVDREGEPFRHPYFIHDSYDSSDAVNRFHWAKANDAEQFPENVKTREYTSGLVAIRRSTDAFRLPTQALVNSNVKLLKCPEINPEDLVLAFSAMATDGDKYFVFINADEWERRLTLSVDLTPGTVVADAEQADPKGLTDWSGFKLTEENITIDPLTVVIIRMSVDKR